MNKKRKCEQLDLEAEKQLYQQFQHCASSVTSLYYAAQAQKSQGIIEGQLKLLDRIQCWVMQQDGQALNRDVLVSFLQMEIQMLEAQQRTQSMKQQAANVHVQNMFPLAGHQCSSRSRNSTRDQGGHESKKADMDFEEDVSNGNTRLK
eukprot:TRINITY_DN38026_c0_g2_i3.p1 TRINITY_DN38026_c0_g2~~TRINITY_DN38026_c0_g2_i3.p1  ORF type:complete len:148 (-),score=22.15 TRINITY_DN38026_c0_g2_i3:410-853(-)